MPKYADIVKKNQQQIVEKIKEEEESESDLEETFVNKKQKLGNYSIWKHVYFKHLLELRNIFISKIGLLIPEWKTYMFSEEFFEVFCKMIYNNSSKKLKDINIL